MTHPLDAPIYTESRQKLPKTMRTGDGGPRFCWHCFKDLQKAPGKGLVYFNLVLGPDGHEHRVHGDCTQQAIDEGARLVP